MKKNTGVMINNMYLINLINLVLKETNPRMQNKEPMIFKKEI